jgi:hypothetical protein
MIIISELSHYSEADSCSSSQQLNQFVPTLNQKYKSTMEYPNSSASSFNIIPPNYTSCYNLAAFPICPLRCTGTARGLFHVTILTFLWDKNMQFFIKQL